MGGALLQHLHYRRRSSDLGFGNQQVNVFGHDYISHDDEAVPLTSLLQDRKEAIATARAVEKRQSPVTGAGDKVQVMRTVTAMQAAGHDKRHGTSSIAPALAQNARTGHPHSETGREMRKAWATRPLHGATGQGDSNLQSAFGYKGLQPSSVISSYIQSHILSICPVNLQ